jgi:hypothetical protein
MRRRERETPHPGLAIPAGAIGLYHADRDVAYSMPAFYKELYGIAVWLRHESIRWHNAGESARDLVTGKPFAWHERSETVAECRCAMACILHCFLTLEAYINAYGAWYAHVPDSPLSGMLGHLDRLPTDTKWLLYPRLVNGQPVSDRGKEPFQSFTRLKKVRDHLIVHPKPRMNVDDSVVKGPDGHPSLAGGRAKSSLTELSDWREMPCDAEAAKWACDLAALMIRQLFDSMTDAPFPAAPLDLPPFTS